MVDGRCRKVQATSHTSTNDHPLSFEPRQNIGNACISLGLDCFWEDVRLRGGRRAGAILEDMMKFHEIITF